MFPAPRLPSPPLPVDIGPKALPDDLPAAETAIDQPSKPSSSKKDAKQAKGGGSRWEKLPGQDEPDRSKDRVKPATAESNKDRKSEKDPKLSKDKAVKTSKDKDKDKAEEARRRDREKDKDRKGERSKDADKERDRGRERSPKARKEEGSSKRKRKRSHSRYLFKRRTSCLSFPVQMLSS